METKIETLEDNRIKVSATIDAKEVASRITKEYKDLAKRYKFPGFRPGKAPRPVIDNMMGGSETVMAAVTDDIVNESYPLIIDQDNIFPVGKPEFDEDMALVEDGKDFTFDFTVEVKPEFELTNYKPVEVQLFSTEVSEEDIDRQAEDLAARYYTFEEAPKSTKITEDCRVALDMTTIDSDGNEIDDLTSPAFEYNMGSGFLPEEFESELIGLKKGAKKEFTIKMPKEPTAYTMQLVGKTATLKFNIKVESVKTRAIPEITDEWVNNMLGYEDVEEFRSRLRDDITRQRDIINPRMKEQQCLHTISIRLKGDAPAGLVEETESRLLQEFFQSLQEQGVTYDAYLKQNDMTAEQFKEDLHHQADDLTREDLALDAWARHYGIEATPEDITKEFEDAGVENPKLVEDTWRKNGQLYLIKEGIVRNKALEDLLEKAIVAEVDIDKIGEEEPAGAAEEQAEA